MTIKNNFILWCMSILIRSYHTENIYDLESSLPVLTVPSSVGFVSCLSSTKLHVSLSWLMVQDCVLISVSWHCVYMPGVWQQLVIACLQGLWSSVGAVDRGRCSNDSLLCDIHKPAAVWSAVLPVHPQGQKSFCPDSLPSCSTQLLCWVACSAQLP